MRIYHDGKTGAELCGRSDTIIKIILEDKYHVQPTYYECPPNLGSMLLEHNEYKSNFL